MREKGTWRVAIVRFVIVSVVFVSVLAAIDAKWKLSSINLSNGGENKVEQVRIIHCENEVQDISSEGSYLDFEFPQLTQGNNSFVKTYNALFAKRSLRQIVSKLFSQEDQIHLECIQESISSWPNLPRRTLRFKTFERVDSQSAPTHSPTPSPNVASVPPVSAPKSPAASSPPAPSPSQHFSPPPQPPKSKPPPPPTPLPPPPPTVHPPPQNPPSPPPKTPSDALPDQPDEASPEQPNDDVPKKPPSAHHRKPKSAEGNEDDKTNMIIAVAACTVAVLVFVAILLICCLKKLEDDDDNVIRLKDEKPFLKLGTGPADSSQNIENPGNRIPNTLATDNLSVATENNGLFGIQTTASGVGPGNPQAPLPLPPGKAAPPPPKPPAPPAPPAPAAPPPPKPPAPKAPPPPMARPPPNPPKPGMGPKSAGPRPPHRKGLSASSDGTEGGDSPKTKLKPFFWDKVNASPDHSMVWHEIKAGSFQFNEEMMESLFGYAPADQNKNERKKDSSLKPTQQFVQIIDAKKAQNLAILLKALNVTTEEVCDALNEGNELPTELLQTLLKMAPTSDEELKLRLYTGEISELGPADRFLKILIEIPFAFKRMESLLFMSSLQEEVSYIKESFATLEVACNELKNSRLFLKLLEAVLKTGNRMNTGTYRGGAQAFKLDTLLKLSDVKATDGKITLLHFVVQEIIRTEGIRAARRLRESHSMSSVKTEDLTEDSSQDSEDYHKSLGLQAVSGLSKELKNVKKAAVIDGDNLTQSVAKLGHSLLKAKNFLNNDMMNLDGESEFRETLASFVEHAEGKIPGLLEDEKRIMALVKSTGDYFHGNSGKDEGLRLFVIVRDFLIILDKVCKEVEKSTKQLPVKAAARKERSTSLPSSQDSRSESLPDIRQQPFPAIAEQKELEDFSSDDDSSSP